LLDPAGVSHANMLLSTHAAPAHMDLPALAAMLEASPGSKLVLPRYTAALANANGIPFDRMTTTDNSLRVEYFGMGDYMRVYSVPSMPPHVAASPVDGYPSLGYLIRGGNWTIYHAGECAPYEGLSQRLRPYNVTVALLPVTGPPGNFSPAEAADLANEIAAKWVVPIGYGMFAGRQADPRAFAEQVLSRYPSLRVKLFEPGEAWQIPED
jgi:L-ascorbate metabolism protein UlaG (beta-lactamase superfamily)